ncbi:energy-coupling factor transporter transmembrane component T [Agromyces mediolanus]|uniref:energy-coupling factor transporter transmembrane component T n=1 Tax=Agromyces mediolanus TaxID=41986 RepID=UPI00383623C9
MSAPGETSVARGGPLRSLNALAKLAGPVPVMIALVFTRGVPLPLAFAVFAALVLLLGARLGLRWILVVVLGVPALAALLGVSFGIWVDPATLPAGAPGAELVLAQLGDWRFTGAMYLVGLATALRIAAIILLAFISGLTTTGAELVRALVQQLRVPYRLGYTALAAMRFVPRFGHELEVIRAARRVRGVDRGRGPIAWLRSTVGLAVPLLASAIRHAERVALAMDARAFGASGSRTERTISSWRARDTLFVIGFWLAAGLLWWAVEAAVA